MDSVEIIVIGAGVVGLATARALALRGREVLILESETAIASVASARNSGVIHAGIYYKPGSFKARFCVEGRDKLYAYAAERGIPCKRCGKLVVATSDDQLPKLHEWKNIAEQNGVTGLKLLSAAEAKAIEPELYCVAALSSPDTGLIDVHEYAHALLGDAENAGAMLALQTPVTNIAPHEGGFIVSTGGDAPTKLGCKILINAAGLSAQAVARNIVGLKPETIPPQVLAKGNYFSLSGKPPFSQLIYPLPVLGSSGLHYSCGLEGHAHFGPDVEWVDTIDYTVDPSRRAAFEEQVSRYWPNLPRGALQPDYAGIRPKIARASPHDTDFIIQTAAQHGINGLINLYGIESPGLTSSLAIGDYTAGLVRR